MKTVIYLRWLIFVVTAELVASFAVWHGTPTDWPGEHLHFWHFELLRSRYWLGFSFTFAVLFLFGRMIFRGRSSDFAAAISLALSAVATETLASFYFRRSLSWNWAAFLGWQNARRYLIEHLIFWATTLAFLFLCWWILRGGKASRSDPSQTE